jgi:hypothetical protein
MTQSGQPSKILHANPEHGGLRFVVIIVLLLGLILGFIMIQLLLSLLAANTILIEFSTILSCAGAILLALGIAWATEIYLKRAWPSGNMLLLGDSELVFQMGKRGQSQTEEDFKKIVFNWSKNLNLTRWYFDLSGYPRAGRERRVSSKWLCLACQLQQDEARLILFSYLPPEEAAVWTENRRLVEPFHSISLAHLYSESGKKIRGAATRPKIPASMLTGSDGPYWLAEQKRWQEGLELTQEDFATFMEYIEQKI